jgi:hypothetical protein
MLAAATNLINTLLACAIVLACLAIAGSITRQTRCSLRLGVFGLFVGAALYAAGGIFKFGDWADMVLLGGVLIYLVSNVRGAALFTSSRRADRVAWLVIGIVLVALGWTAAT